MNAIATTFAAVLSIGLAACVAETTSGRVAHDDAYGLFAAAAGGREMPVVIVNNPFSVADAALGKAVTDAMQGHANGPETHFTTRPSTNVEPRFRIVVMFEPATGLADHNLCKARVGDLPPRPGGPGDGLDAVMAFCGAPRLRSVFCRGTAVCRGTILLSVVNGSAPATGPGDERFRRLIAAMTRDLISSRSDIPSGRN
jgi:hypothetical protein